MKSDGTGNTLALPQTRETQDKGIQHALADKNKGFSPSGLSAQNELEAPPLISFQQTILDEREVIIVREALQRGASYLQLAAIIFHRRYGREPKQQVRLISGEEISNYRDTVPYYPKALPYGTSVISGSDVSMLITDLQTNDRETMEGISRIIEPQIAWYRDMARGEFDALSIFVSLSFKPFQGASDELAFDNYLSLRAAYYREGYSQPKRQILDQIISPNEGARLLNRVIVGGIHKIFLEKLVGLRNLLMEWTEKWSPGEATRISNQIGVIGGFNPRYQGGTKILSNHAFGLAIDIDSSVNPHIKHKDVINILKRRANGIDLGNLLVEAAILDKFGMERVSQIHLKLSAAQEAFIPWLRKTIDRENELKGEIKIEQVNAKKAKTNQSKGEATDRIGKKKKELAADEDIKDLLTLRKHHPIEVKEWSRRGILTVPLLLVVALKRLGFKWGGEYKESKDQMHVELEHRQVLPPDSRRRTGFDDLRIQR